MEWTALIRILNKYDTNTCLLFYWADGLIIKGTVDTISETDNSFYDTAEYKEYYMALVEVKKIIRRSENTDPTVYVGALLEVSEEFEPFKIELEDHSIVWSKESDNNSRKEID